MLDVRVLNSWASALLHEGQPVDLRAVPEGLHGFEGEILQGVLNAYQWSDCSPATKWLWDEFILIESPANQDILDLFDAVLKVLKYMTDEGGLQVRPGVYTEASYDAAQGFITSRLYLKKTLCPHDIDAGEFAKASYTMYLRRLESAEKHTTLISTMTSSQVASLRSKNISDRYAKIRERAAIDDAALHVTNDGEIDEYFNKATMALQQPDAKEAIMLGEDEFDAFSEGLDLGGDFIDDIEGWDVTEPIIEDAEATMLDLEVDERRLDEATADIIENDIKQNNDARERSAKAHKLNRRRKMSLKASKCDDPRVCESPAAKPSGIRVGDLFESFKKPKHTLENKEEREETMARINPHQSNYRGGQQQNLPNQMDVMQTHQDFVTSHGGNEPCWAVDVRNNPIMDIDGNQVMLSVGTVEMGCCHSTDERGSLLFDNHGLPIIDLVFDGYRFPYQLCRTDQSIIMDGYCDAPQQSQPQRRQTPYASQRQGNQPQRQQASAVDGNEARRERLRNKLAGKPAPRPRHTHQQQHQRRDEPVNEQQPNPASVFDNPIHITTESGTKLVCEDITVAKFRALPENQIAGHIAFNPNTHVPVHTWADDKLVELLVTKESIMDYEAHKKSFGVRLKAEKGEGSVDDIRDNDYKAEEEAKSYIVKVHSQEVEGDLPTVLATAVAAGFANDVPFIVPTRTVSFIPDLDISDKVKNILEEEASSDEETVAQMVNVLELLAEEQGAAFNALDTRLAKAVNDVLKFNLGNEKPYIESFFGDLKDIMNYIAKNTDRYVKVDDVGKLFVERVARIIREEVILELDEISVSDDVEFDEVDEAAEEVEHDILGICTTTPVLIVDFDRMYTEGVIRVSNEESLYRIVDSAFAEMEKQNMNYNSLRVYTQANKVYHIRRLARLRTHGTYAITDVIELN